MFSGEPPVLVCVVLVALVANKEQINNRSKHERRKETILWCEFKKIFARFGLRVQLGQRQWRHELVNDDRFIISQKLSVLPSTRHFLWFISPNSNQFFVIDFFRIFHWDDKLDENVGGYEYLGIPYEQSAFATWPRRETREKSSTVVHYHWDYLDSSDEFHGTMVRAFSTWLHLLLFTSHGLFTYQHHQHYGRVHCALCAFMIGDIKQCKNEASESDAQGWMWVLSITTFQPRVKMMAV